MKIESTAYAIVQHAHAWTADQTFEDNVKITLGTGGDVDFYYDGTDTFLDLRVVGTGDLMIALAGSFPSPDPDNVHIWKGSAGAVTASATSGLIIEDSAGTGITILTPNSASGVIFFGDEDSATVGEISYSHANTRLQLATEAAFSVFISGGSTPTLSLRGAGTIDTSSGNLTLSPSSRLVSALASASAATNVSLDGSNQFQQDTSSECYKYDKRDLEIDTSRIYQLMPRSFHFGEKKPDAPEDWPEAGGEADDFGLTAEEVYSVIPELVNIKDGRPFSVRYQLLSVLLLNEMKKLKEAA